jgi:hypothetical protein
MDAHSALPKSKTVIVELHLDNILADSTHLTAELRPRTLPDLCLIPEAVRESIEYYFG